MLTKSTVDICRYTYYDQDNDTFVLICARNKGNSKTTGDEVFHPMIDTTIFSGDQVRENDFDLDEKNCGNCPRSENNRDPNIRKGCYARSGNERFALVRMLAFTHRRIDQIRPFNHATLEKWWETATTFTSFTLLRHGRYGDPFFMNHDLIFLLNSWVREAVPSAGIVGYTHQGHRPEAKILLSTLQFSADYVSSAEKALDAGHSVFFVAEDQSSLDWFLQKQNTRHCPASSQARAYRAKTSQHDYVKPVACSDCQGCGGTKSSRPLSYGLLAH